jgi:hypothetical protein
LSRGFHTLPALIQRADTAIFWTRSGKKCGSRGAYRVAVGRDGLTCARRSSGQGRDRDDPDDGIGMRERGDSDGLRGCMIAVAAGLQAILMV